MTNIDLNAARRARAEKAGEAHTITFGDPEVVYELPREAPFDFAEALATQDVRKALTVLLNGQADAFFAASPSLDDMTELMNGLGEMYAGLQAGESRASGTSSSRTSKSSRPRSKSSTG